MFFSLFFYFLRHEQHVTTCKIETSTRVWYMHGAWYTSLEPPWRTFTMLERLARLFACSLCLCRVSQGADVP